MVIQTIVVNSYDSLIYTLHKLFGDTGMLRSNPHRYDLNHSGAAGGIFRANHVNDIADGVLRLVSISDKTSYCKTSQVSKPRDLYLALYDRSAILQTHAADVSVKFQSDMTI